MQYNKSIVFTIIFQFFFATLSYGAILQVFNEDPSNIIKARIFSPSNILSSASWQPWVTITTNNSYTFNTGINSIMSIQWSQHTFGENIPEYLAWQSPLNLPGLTPYSKFVITDFNQGKYKTTFGQEGQGHAINQPIQKGHDWRVQQ